jgi:predicted SnoaL-like aldol condensation-catalyzing enzyme
MSLKERAKRFLLAVNSYDTAMIEGMLHENYIQHNPHVPTGRAAFLKMMLNLEQSGSKIFNLRMIQEGRFVIMHHIWHNATPFGYDQAIAFHIIRFDEDCLIAEHWNVMQEHQSRNACVCSQEAQGLETSRTQQNKNYVATLFEPKKFQSDNSFNLTSSQLLPAKGDSLDPDTQNPSIPFSYGSVRGQLGSELKQLRIQMNSHNFSITRVGVELQGAAAVIPPCGHWGTWKSKAAKEGQNPREDEKYFGPGCGSYSQVKFKAKEGKCKVKSVSIEADNPAVTMTPSLGDFSKDQEKTVSLQGSKEVHRIKIRLERRDNDEKECRFDIDLVQ